MTATSVSEEIRRFWDDDAASYDTSPSHYPRRPQRQIRVTITARWHRHPGQGTALAGDLPQAEGCHWQALDLARAIASSWDKAHAMAGLGRCAMADGRATQAKALLRQALQVFQRTGAAEALDLRAELDALTGPPPA